MSGDLLEDIRSLVNNFSSYSMYSKEREKKAKEEIFLDSQCPKATQACDPSYQECPDEEYALSPKIYNSDGLRCYSDVNMKRVKARSPTEVRTQHQMVMDMVKMAGQLNNDLKTKLEDLQCGDLGKKDLCGMKSSCKWINDTCSST